MTLLGGPGAPASLADLDGASGFGVLTKVPVNFVRSRPVMRMSSPISLPSSGARHKASHSA